MSSQVALIPHTKNKPRKPARKDFAGDCRRKNKTTKLVIAKLHQGKYKGAAKPSKATNNMLTKNFMLLN